MSEFLLPSILDHGKIRIAIVPVGNINSLIYSKYATLISEKTSIKYNQLTRFKDDNLKSPFKKNNWEKGSVNLQFVDETSYSSNEFCDFQLYRKIHAVIGIMSCLNEETVKDGFEKFNQLKSKFPSALVWRCFAVEPSDNQLDNVGDDLIMIPRQEVHHYRFYFETFLNDIASELIRLFEKIASNATQYLVGLNSIDMYTANGDSNLPKRKQNRINKIFADCAFLIGDYTDAQQKYQITYDVAKSFNGDDLHQAGSLEGIAASMLYIANENISPDLANEVIDLYSQALDIVLKTPYTFLYAEMCIKLAHFCITFAKSRRNLALEMANNAFAAASNLSKENRLYFSILAAKIVKSLGYRRKTGFYLHAASLMYNQLKDKLTAYRLASNCLEAFDIPLEFDHSSWLFRKKSRKVPKGWETVQIQFIIELVNYLSALNDFQLQIQLILYLFSQFHEFLEESQQQYLFQLLYQIPYTATMEVPKCLKPLPILHYMKPVALPEHLNPIKQQVAEITKEKSVFIFSPFEKQKEEKLKLNWVHLETCSMEIGLFNPFKMDLKLNRVGLIVKSSSAPCEVYDSEMILKSNSFATCFVNVRPLGVGKVEIESVTIEFQNLPFLNMIEIPWIPKTELEDFEITVVESQPILQINSSNYTIHALDGEYITFPLQLQNIGNKQMDTLQLECSNDTASDIRIEKQSLTSILPLKEGSSALISLQINAKWNGTFVEQELDEEKQKSFSFSISFEYGYKELWRRKLIVPFTIHVQPSVTIQQLFSINQKQCRKIMVTLGNYTKTNWFRLYCNHHQQEEEKVKLLLAPGESKTIPLEEIGNFSLPYVQDDFSTIKEQIGNSLLWKTNLQNRGHVSWMDYSVEPKPSVTSYVSIAQKQLQQQQFVKEEEQDIEPTVELQIENQTYTIQNNQCNTIQVELGQCIQVKSRIRVPIKVIPPPAPLHPPSKHQPIQTQSIISPQSEMMRVSFRMLQDAENGSIMVPNSTDFASAGKRKVIIPRNVREGEKQLFENEVHFFTLSEGHYKLIVDYQETVSGKVISPTHMIHIVANAPKNETKVE